MDIINEINKIVTKAYKKIPVAKYNLITRYGTIPVTAFGIQAEKIRTKGEGKTILASDNLGVCLDGIITNLR